VLAEEHLVRDLWVVRAGFDLRAEEQRGVN
jgi:hypothetical protein